MNIQPNKISGRYWGFIIGRDLLVNESIESLGGDYLQNMVIMLVFAPLIDEGLNPFSFTP